MNEWRQNAHHIHGRIRPVGIVAGSLIHERSSGFQRIQNDQGCSKQSQICNGPYLIASVHESRISRVCTVLLSPSREGMPLLVTRHLQKISDERESDGTRRRRGSHKNFGTGEKSGGKKAQQSEDDDRCRRVKKCFKS